MLTKAKPQHLLILLPVSLFIFWQKCVKRLETGNRRVNEYKATEIIILPCLLRSLREEKLEWCVKQHRQMMKARGEKLKGTSQMEMKKAKQDIDTVSIFSFCGSTVKTVLCAD